MTLVGKDLETARPGQFVGLALDGLTLRRPISVCDAQNDTLTLIYKVVGEGTAQMAAMQPGKEIDTLLYLGNGYTLEKSGEAPVLLGGGVGVPPLYLLAKKLIAEGKKPRVILGFNTASEIFYAEEFAALGLDVTVTTVDGSLGVKGFVTDALKAMDGYTYTFACGPEPMLKAIWNTAASDGQYS
ncbi:MAG: dihydroorotate dehydrogenase electron transfer subunit, partial [Clostridia bacterium]|nr:dihydroorotate dehydrogenase electron transfer subunit [Clostridia bacterium]